MRPDSKVSADVILKFLNSMAQWPFATVCRHNAAGLLLSSMEESDPSLSEDPDFLRLCDAFMRSSAGDCDASKTIAEVQQKGGIDRQPDSH